ncbi:MAG: hypothetical protein MJH09_00955 [Cetobacterium sp.]|nr:hypothetical protein [Cetobacterium sp.]
MLSFVTKLKEILEEKYPVTITWEQNFISETKPELVIIPRTENREMTSLQGSGSSLTISVYYYDFWSPEVELKRFKELEKIVNTLETDNRILELVVKKPVTSFGAEAIKENEDSFTGLFVGAIEIKVTERRRRE